VEIEGCSNHVAGLSQDIELSEGGDLYLTQTELGIKPWTKISLVRTQLYYIVNNFSIASKLLISCPFVPAKPCLFQIHIHSSTRNVFYAEKQNNS
jgi:hypothetical protein